MARGPVAVFAAAALVACGAPATAEPASGAVAGPVARIGGRIDGARRVELPGHVHPALRQSEDLGVADPQQRADRLILLLRASRAQGAALEQFLRDVQSRGRAQFHRWLTPSGFAKRFGVAPADIAAVRRWLESQGFRVEEAPQGGRSLIISGTLGQLNDAFAAPIHEYRWRGERHLAAAANPRIPQALAPVILGFASLHDFRRSAQHVVGPRREANLTNGTHAIGPGDFATIYNLNAPYAQGLSGAGRSIAVLGRTDVAAADLSQFHTTFGLAASAPTILVNGADPGLVSGDELESDLDLEWAGGIAPSATLKFVTSKSTQLSDGIDLSAQYAVSNNLADIVSLSYGACEAPGDISQGTTFYNQLWQQAAAQGTSVFVSSGDSGAAGCDAPSSTTATQGLGVNQLCSSPYSTCVGGTEFTADVGNPSGFWSASNSPTFESALGYIGEAVWNESGTQGFSQLWSSGGGASSYFAKPAWQLATGVPSDGHRDVPDLALNAAAQHDEYLIYTSDGHKSSTLVGVGGTSAAAPSMAGIAALVAEAQGSRVGNFNPILYGLSELQQGGAAPVFHRISTGNNSVPGQSGFSASASDSTYNQATGLGSVDGALLIAHFGDVAAPATALAPTSVVVAPTATIGSATLTVPATTSWSASVSSAAASWLSITPTSGTGSADFTYSTSANPATSARSGTITIAAQVLAVTQAAASAGGGNSARLGTSASALAFGSDPVGTATTSRRLLISDTGNANLTLGTIGFGGSAPGDFSDSGSCVAGLVLVPGASCYLDIRFDPNATGARSADLQIAATGQGTTDVSLTGTGAPAGVNVPVPAWALGALGAVLGAAARRRLRSAPPTGRHPRHAPGNRR